MPEALLDSIEWRVLGAIELADSVTSATFARAQRVLIERRPEDATSASLPRDWPQPDAELFEAMAAAA